MMKSHSSLSFLSEIQGFEFTDEEMERLKLWPQGIIPYFIDDFSFDKVLRDDIRMVLNDANGYGGVHFMELGSPPDDLDTRYVFFINRRGAQNCHDLASKDLSTKGVQKVILGYDCMTYGELAAVVLAIVGVPPQHNAPNRNYYISVQLGNVMPEKRYLYDNVKDNEWLFHELNYDFGSAGHYDFHTFTVNGKATIKPLRPGRIPDLNQVGDPIRFSENDVIKMRMLYNYINKKPNAQVPQCSELFKPGTNFSRFESDTEDEIKPRSKPNRYLGRPDDNHRIENNDILKNTHSNSDTETLEKLKEKSNFNKNQTIIDKLSKLSDFESDSNRK